MTIPVTLIGTYRRSCYGNAYDQFWPARDFDIELSANVLPDGLVVIGDGTANNYMPVNVWYGYSYAQMLYRA